MKFDEDLMQEVMDQAPPGVVYERAEVHAALVWAMDARPLIIWPTAIQKAARAAITRRREAAEAAAAAEAPSDFCDRDVT